MWSLTKNMIKQPLILFITSFYPLEIRTYVNVFHKHFGCAVNTWIASHPHISGPDVPWGKINSNNLHVYSTLKSLKDRLLGVSEKYFSQTARLWSGLKVFIQQRTRLALATRPNTLLSFHLLSFVKIHPSSCKKSSLCGCDWEAKVSVVWVLIFMFFEC